MFKPNTENRKIVSQAFRITEKEKQALIKGARIHKSNITDFIRHCIKEELELTKYK